MAEGAERNWLEKTYFSPLFRGPCRRGGRSLDAQRRPIEYLPPFQQLCLRQGQPTVAAEFRLFMPSLASSASMGANSTSMRRSLSVSDSRLKSGRGAMTTSLARCAPLCRCGDGLKLRDRVAFHAHGVGVRGASPAAAIAV
jgi:hypothetical protein